MVLPNGVQVLGVVGAKLSALSQKQILMISAATAALLLVVGASSSTSAADNRDSARISESLFQGDGDCNRTDITYEEAIRITEEDVRCAGYLRDADEANAAAAAAETRSGAAFGAVALVALFAIALLMKARQSGLNAPLRDERLSPAAEQRVMVVDGRSKSEQQQMLALRRAFIDGVLTAEEFETKREAIDREGQAGLGRIKARWEAIDVVSHSACCFLARPGT